MMPSGSGRKKLILLTVALALLLAGGVAAGLYFKNAQGQEEGVTAEKALASDSKGEVAHASNKGDGSDDDADSEAEEKADGEEGEKDKDGEEEKEKKQIPVSVAQIRVAEMSTYIVSTANLVPENDVEILAEAEGRVVEVLVEEGDMVRRGQPLATLVKEDAEIVYKKAQVKTVNARMNFERAEKMAKEELMSQEEFDRLRMEHEVALQEEAEAKWRLDKTTFRSPFGGRLTERIVMPGMNVRMGDPLFRVADFDPLIAKIYLPEKDILDLQEGREVKITLKADETLQFPGRIRQISPVVDTGTGTVKVTVEVSNPPSMVRPGAFINIAIVRETRPEAMVVPREAIIRELQNAYVFVADGEKAQRRDVALGLEEGDHIEILSGVEVGEQVIVAGQGNLKDGTEIKIIPPSGNSALVKRRNAPRHG